MTTNNDQPIEIPLTSTLDLHTFRPSEVASVVEEYLLMCREQGLLQIRIVHGKGIGNLRRTVQSLLAKLDFVDHWEQAGHDAGHWGATLVWLKPS